MYQINLQNIIEKLPIMTNSSHDCANATNYLHGTKRSFIGGNFVTTAIILIFILTTITGCNTSGSVGNEVVGGDGGANTITVDVDDITLLDTPTFSGRLPHTSIGRIEDPAYGTLQSSAIIKPVISKAQVDTITESNSMLLKLIFNPAVYGNENSVSEFEIFEVDEIWRGTQLRYGDDVAINRQNKVGEFLLTADEDTATVELSNQWKESFAEYFNSISADRDSTYRQNFTGLAIVPSGNNEVVRFLKHSAEEEEDEITSFLVRSTVVNEDGEEETEDNVLDARDWATVFNRTNEPSSENSFIVHNTNNVLKVKLQLPEEQLNGRNIVNAQLFLYKNSAPEDLTSTISRPPLTQVRAHIFDELPNDVMADIFTSNADFFTNSEEDEDELFNMNITQFVLDEVYGSQENRELYITIQAVNGILYSTHFFDTSDDTLNPKIVITTVE
jgi:hypothetical protein